MKAFVTGSAGQLGRALAATAPPGTSITGHDIDTLDITDEEAVLRAVEQAAPDFIINAAAYTAVDKAETEEELALTINGTAVGHLKKAAQASEAKLVQVSTDFVFDGTASSPYRVDAQPNPISAYGRTKLAGEQAAGTEALVVRTAWIHAAQGANFVRTMLRLMAERDELRVVADQIGTPTWATSLAETIWALAAQGTCGIYHHTDGGTASWYDFAEAIKVEALSLGLLKKDVKIHPISTAEYPTPAQRPAYSVLDKSKTIAALGRTPLHWSENLRCMLDEVTAHG